MDDVEVATDDPKSGGISRRDILKGMGLLSSAGLVSSAFPNLLGAATGEITTYDKGYRFDKNGWVYIHIEGEPYDRGFQHGFLMASELDEILRTIKYLTVIDTGKDWEFFVEAATGIFNPHIEKEYLDEIKGIATGAKEAGVDITWQEVMLWNGYFELLGYWWPTVVPKLKYDTGFHSTKEHCSAFIATGSVTGSGGVVMAHNSWDDFSCGQFFNLILDIKPKHGNSIFMQSVPGYIHSMADFFITGAGIMGTETTIAGFNEYNEKKAPEFLRVRKAMQYAKDMDEFVDIMKEDNSGGYANSWLLADRRTGEIMRFELGLEFSDVQRTRDGYFIGFNAPYSPQIRNLECLDTYFTDIRVPEGARMVRLTQLMEKYHGKIDVEIGKKIMADHYDVYLKKSNNPCSRTVEGHYELDDMAYMFQPRRPPFQPKGAVDGKVMNSKMAKEMTFWARWGNSSGMPFDAKEFLEEHIQWRYLDGYLKDRPSQPWTLFSSGMK